MKVYVVFGSNWDGVSDNEQILNIFLTVESAQNFINQNECWDYPRIEEWEAEQ